MPRPGTNRHPRVVAERPVQVPAGGIRASARPVVFPVPSGRDDPRPRGEGSWSQLGDARVRLEPAAVLNGVGEDD